VDSLERILQAKAMLDEGAIDNFAPGEKAAAERALWVQEYFARILRIVQQENEAAGRSDEVASQDVGEELERES
jgi:hypothetical protein